MLNHWVQQISTANSVILCGLIFYPEIAIHSWHRPLGPAKLMYDQNQLTNMMIFLLLLQWFVWTVISSHHPHCIEKYPNSTGLYASQMTMVTKHLHKNYTWFASNVLRTVREKIMASGKFLNLQNEAKFKNFEITKQIHSSSLFTRLTDIFHHVWSNYVALNSKCWTQLELTNDLSRDSLVYAQVYIFIYMWYITRLTGICTSFHKCTSFIFRARFAPGMLVFNPGTGFRTGPIVCISSHSYARLEVTTPALVFFDKSCPAWFEGEWN
jgi:hypothetical protein